MITVLRNPNGLPSLAGRNFTVILSPVWRAFVRLGKNYDWYQMPLRNLCNKREQLPPESSTGGTETQIVLIVK